jgi:hypothetical protein
VLLSADLNPIQGTIDVPGETDSYVFTVDQPKKVYFDSQTPNPGLTWSLSGPDGAKVTDRSLASSDSAGAGATSPILGLVSGDYTLSVSGMADVTGAYKFRLMDLANATPIQPAADISGQLAPGSATNLYSFTGTAGDHLFLDQLSATNPAAMTWHLFDPNGVAVASSSFADLDVPALKLSGAYTLAVEGTVDSTAASNYSFALRPVTDTQASLTLGAVTNGAITSPGQSSNYTFSLSNPTSLYFDSRTNDPGLLWSLSGPRGQEVTGKSFSASDASPAGTSNNVLNLVTGNYTLKVNGSGDHVGAFAFRLVNPQAAGTHIDFGQQIDGTLNPANGTQFYNFDVAALDNISVNLVNVSGGSPYWRLFDGYGRQIWSKDMAAGGAAAPAAPSSGTYTLAIEGAPDAATPASFSFQVVKGTPASPPAAGTPISVGARVDATIGQANPQLSYTFNLASATKLYFEDIGASNSTSWSLSGPRGNEVANWSFSTSSAPTSNDANRVLDLIAGSYTLTVTGPVSSSISFRLLDFASATPLTLNQPITATPPAGATTLLYKFDATAGDPFYFDQRSYTGNFAYWRVFDPYGRQVLFSQFQGNLINDPLNLPVTGTYTLAIQGFGSLGTVGFGVDRIAGPTTPISMGSVVNGTIAVPKQVNRYTFTLTNPAQLYFDSLVSDSNISLVWSLTGPRGSEVSSAAVRLDGVNGQSTGATPVLSLIPGDYTLSITNSATSNSEETPNYSFRLLDLASATPLTIGATVSGSLDISKGTALYNFDGVAGDHLYYDTRTYVGQSATTRLLDPYGNLVWTSSPTSDKNTPSLPSTGKYTLAIESSLSDTTPASYSFVVQRVTNQTVPITLGSRVDGSVVQGQENHYTFTLANPTAVYLDNLLRDSNQSWILIGPRGQETSQGFGNDSSPLLALVAGTYTIVIPAPTSQSTANAYSFRLLDMSAATPVTLNQLTSGTLDFPTGATVFRFDATAGSRFSYDQLQVNIRPFDPAAAGVGRLDLRRCLQARYAGCPRGSDAASCGAHQLGARYAGALLPARRSLGR